MSRTVISEIGTVDFANGPGLSVETTATFTGATTFSSSISAVSLPTSPVQALAASASISQPGVYTLDNVTPSGYLLPNPANVPGGVYVFRALSSQAHFLTSSSANRGKFITDGTAAGSKVTITAVVGSSISLISDGLSFCKIANSGSVTFSGT